MRTVNENRGEVKREYAFTGTKFAYCGEEPDNRSCFYAFGMQRQAEFAGYSDAKGSTLVGALKERFLD